MMLPTTSPSSTATNSPSPRASGSPGPRRPDRPGRAPAPRTLRPVRAARGFERQPPRKAGERGAHRWPPLLSPDVRIGETPRGDRAIAIARETNRAIPAGDQRGGWSTARSLSSGRDSCRSESFDDGTLVRRVQTGAAARRASPAARQAEPGLRGASRRSGRRCLSKGGHRCAPRRPCFPRWLSHKAASSATRRNVGGAGLARPGGSGGRGLLAGGEGDLVAVELGEVVGEHREPPLGPD